MLDNQEALKNTLQATTFEVEENSRTFQGLPLKFKDLQECANPVTSHSRPLLKHRIFLCGTLIEMKKAALNAREWLIYV